MQKPSFFRISFVKPSVLLALTIALMGIGSAKLSLAASAAGVWTVAFAPSFDISTFLTKVTCTSASDCWVVGNYAYEPNATDKTLIEHWNGTEWVVVGSPNIDNQDSYLDGVTCASASDCWAAGYYNNGTADQTLLEHWDGATWTIVSSPNTSASRRNYFNNITCVSSSDCWAYGAAENTSNIRQTLIEHWNGTAWTIVTSSNTSATEGNRMVGVACPSSSDCWGVGFYGNSSNMSQTLTEHWDGTAWTIVPSPNTAATQDNFLYNLACPSASDCRAVGVYIDSTGLQRTLTEHWDGTAWAIIASPNTTGAQDNNTLYNVTCASASDCWAVGQYYNDTASQALIEHWNGTAWKMVGVPRVNGTDAALLGVTCNLSSDCWATGSYNGTDYSLPLIEHYSTSNKLGDISTRLNVQTGPDVAIAGFIISGEPQKVLIRALGPTLAAPPFNVPNTLVDPTLVVYDHTQTPIASNDNWPNTVVDGTVVTGDQSGIINNSDYRPSSANEPVIIASLPGGSYTAVVNGVNNTTGVGLVEVYDLTPTDSGSLTNISTRGSVQTGADVMIGGFIVSGAGSRTVVVRGLGPTLTQFGVAGALTDPMLELRDKDGNLLASNDNWKESQEAQIQATGFAPPNDAEPAILATLPPANYTAILRGKNSTSGVALVETYVTN